MTMVACNYNNARKTRENIDGQSWDPFVAGPVSSTLRDLRDAVEGGALGGGVVI